MQRQAISLRESYRRDGLCNKCGKGITWVKRDNAKYATAFNGNSIHKVKCSEEVIDEPQKTKSYIIG